MSMVERRNYQLLWRDDLNALRVQPQNRPYHEEQDTGCPLFYHFLLDKIEKRGLREGAAGEMDEKGS